MNGETTAWGQRAWRRGCRCARLRLHRSLYFYVRHRLQKPQELDALAQITLDRLGTLPQRRLQSEPLRCLHGIAVRAISELGQAVPVAAGAAPSQHLTHDPNARSQARTLFDEQLRSAFTQLPRVHETVLVARTRDGLSTAQAAERLEIPIELIDRYASQAIAIVRQAMEKSAQPGPAYNRAVGNALFTAQAAAEWLCRSPIPNVVERAAFMDWICSSPRHVREVLLVWISNVVLSNPH